jgi:hypothetical protein
MSADNGIYILILKDEYRVIHTQGIENLWWSFLTMKIEDKMSPTMVFEYFDGEESFKDEKSAYERALEIYKKWDYVEYGIRKLYEFRKKTWEDIIKDAKKLAVKEIEVIENMEFKDRKKWTDDLIRLREVLEIQ